MIPIFETSPLRSNCKLRSFSVSNLQNRPNQLHCRVGEVCGSGHKQPVTVLLSPVGAAKNLNSKTKSWCLPDTKTAVSFVVVFCFVTFRLSCCACSATVLVKKLIWNLDNRNPSSFPCNIYMCEQSSNRTTTQFTILTPTLWQISTWET